MIVNKAIEFDPEKRYQTPGEMLTDLKLAVRRIEAADGDQNDPTSEAQSLEGHSHDGEPRTLIVVESDVKMQNMFRDLFKKRGYRVLVTGDPDRAMHRVQEEPTAADLAIFSSGTIGQRAVEVFNEFGENPATKDLPTVLLLGPKQDDLMPQVKPAGRQTVAQMPLKARELRKLVRELLKK